MIGLLVLALAGFVASASEVPVPPLSGAVVDLTGTLAAQDLRSLDDELKAFAARRGSQVAVLLVPTTQPDTIEQYSIRVADAWKIGRAKIDDGVIMVVAKNDRALRIEVGYGLEGAIPDAIAKRVISEVIAPRFRSGDFAGGVREGTRSLMRLIEGEKLPPPEFAPPSSAASGTGKPGVSDLFVPLIIAAVVGGVLMKIFGKVIGASLAGAGFGVLAWWVLGSLVLGLIAALVAFVFALAGGVSGAGHLGGRHGGWSGGGGFGGGGSGGGFGGGGGGFGGGGASGNW